VITQLQLINIIIIIIIIIIILFYTDSKIENNEIPKVEPLFRNSQMLNYSRYFL
jgi:FtsZ-interacting cell division protein ZipA